METLATEDKRYKVAWGILDRCNNEKNKSYERYGGRGIKCLLGSKTREVYENLLKVEGYKEGLQIDRIDNNGHYELCNLRWVTPKENSLNRRNNKCLSYYETNDRERSSFKKICKSRGLNIEDFEEIYSGKRSNQGQKRYYYKFKGER